MNPQPLIIGIAGGSGSGKTTIAKQLAQCLGGEHTTLISLDNYYRNQSELEDSIKGNFDHPNSLDTALLSEHLAQLKQGHSIQMPCYDFSTHSRTDDKILVKSQPFIILDGILLFALSSVRKQLDLSLFVDVPADIRFIRRLMRDVKERGRTTESVVEQYLQTVRPMHEQYVQAFSQSADIIVTNETEIMPSLNALVQQVLALR